MDLETAVSVVAILISVISVMVALVTAVTAAKKEAFTQLERVVERLNQRILELETENEDLRGWAESLVAQIVEVGLTPHSFTPRRGKKY